MQETGHAGRDGLPSVAILHVANKQAYQTEDSITNYYIKKQSCWRQEPINHFDPNKKAEQTLESCGTCKCSDICEIICNFSLVANMTITTYVTYQYIYCNCFSIHGYGLILLMVETRPGKR